MNHVIYYGKIATDNMVQKIAGTKTYDFYKMQKKSTRKKCIQHTEY